MNIITFTEVFVIYTLLGLASIYQCEEYQFLALDVNNDNNTIKDIIQYGLECVVNDEYHTEENRKEIRETLSEIFIANNTPKEWKYPRSFHVTTIYYPSLLPEHPANKAFVEGKEVLIKVKGMVYVLNKLISLFVNVDTPIQNKIPHITVLLREYQAKNSNDVLKRILGSEKYFKKQYYYYSLFDIKIMDDFVLEAVDIEVLNKNETMFIVFFKTEYTLYSKFKSYKRKY